MISKQSIWSFSLLMITLLFACQPSSSEQNTEETTTNDSIAEPKETATLLAFEPEDEIIGLNEQWLGDLDGMIERRRIRALVPYSKTSYFIDGAQRRGAAFEALNHFEIELNKVLGQTGKVPYVRVIFIPLTRDRILPALMEGYGDIAVANLTITPQRQELVDFSDPVLSNVQETVVTGPAAPPINTYEDLIGEHIYIRPSSSYYEHLVAINDSLKQLGQDIVIIEAADENLEDEEILEMVNAGLIPITIVDEHKASFWEKILPNLDVHHDLATFSGGDIAWAMRKNSPLLKEKVNDFVKKNRKGTLNGNIIYNRYLKNTKFVTNTFSSEDRVKFRYTRDYFMKYGEQYNIDWLLLAAQGYQESGLNQNLVSSAGAVGIMQIKPSTAEDPNVNVPNVYNLEDNIHAGTKYLNFIYGRYFNDNELDVINASLFSLASYNAGPARIRKLRKQAAQSGLDPNVWFDNVEIMAARDIGRETVQYVSNIYKYYASYRSLYRYAQVSGKEVLDRR